MRQPDQSDIFVLPKDKKFKGYYKISRHYGWALNTTFKAGFDYVIIVEGMHPTYIVPRLCNNQWKLHHHSATEQPVTFNH